MNEMKIAQFGEGNFLRTFVDSYFSSLNEEGYGKYEVTIIKPITFGSLEAFKKQQCQYNIVLRGVQGDKPVEIVKKITSLKDVIDPFDEIDKFYALARDKDLKIIVSNTTEAGIVFNANDQFDGDFAGITYPAKLTKFLYERYNAHLPGLYLLPVELIDNNGKALEEAVSKYIDLWNLNDGFKQWNKEQNHYCSTLVDRIVSGHPRDEETQKHINELIGYDDPLSSIGEPFGLWVIENKGRIGDLIVDGKHDIDVVLSNDVPTYKKRKVRILNGSHTNLVPLGLLMGKTTVYDCMNDPKLFEFVDKTMIEEILPFVSSNYEDNLKFAKDVEKRFLNPYLNHQLTSISLNSFSKWKERDLPSFADYYNHFGHIPSNMTKGFAALIALYSKIYKAGDKYLVDLPSRTIEIKDDINILDRFASKEPIDSILKDSALWGSDLREFKGLEEAVTNYVSSLLKGESIL